MRTPLALVAAVLTTGMLTQGVYAQQAQTAASEGVSKPAAAIDGAPEPAPFRITPVTPSANSASGTNMNGLSASPDAMAGDPVLQTHTGSLPANAPNSSKPSAYGPYVPLTSHHAAVDPDGQIITADNLVTDDDVSAADLDTPAGAGSNAKYDRYVYTENEVPANELPPGTALRVRLQNSFSTATTIVGTPFQATLLQGVERRGQVFIPAGSILQGRVTEVRGGKRIAGAASIHLNAQTITLPDGNVIALHAQLVSTDQDQQVRVNDEGTIVRRDHAGETLAAMSLTTGSATVAGALLGGGVGALVGAGVGAGLSAAWWLKQDHQAGLPENSTLVFTLTTPLVFGHSAEAMLDR
jgi:hypothetical protein